MQQKWWARTTATKQGHLEAVPTLLPAEEEKITEGKIWSVAKWFDVSNGKLTQNDKKKNLFVLSDRH